MSKDTLPIAIRKKGEKQDKKSCIENPETIEVRFGKRVRKLRLQRRLSQDVVAQMAQVHRNYISEVERGKRNVSLRIIDQLAQALGVETKDLFD